MLDHFSIHLLRQTGATVITFSHGEILDDFAIEK
jgi:hypothetical protein